MTHAAAIAIGRNDRHLAERAQRACKRNETGAGNAVIVDDENLHARAGGRTNCASKNETMLSTSAPRNADQKLSTRKPTPN